MSRLFAPTAASKNATLSKKEIPLTPQNKPEARTDRSETVKSKAYDDVESRLFTSTAAAKLATTSRKEIPLTAKSPLPTGRTDSRLDAAPIKTSPVRSYGNVESRLFSTTAASTNSVTAKREVSSRTSTLRTPVGSNDEPSRRLSSGYEGVGSRLFASTAASCNSKTDKRDHVSPHQLSGDHVQRATERVVSSTRSKTPSKVTPEINDENREELVAVVITPVKEVPKEEPIMVLARLSVPIDTRGQYPAKIFNIDNALLHMQIFHLAFKITINSLSAFLGAGNMKDFAFIWEEFQKALVVLSDIEQSLVFPTLDSASSLAVTAASLAPEIASERHAANAVNGELKETRRAGNSAFEEWKRLAVPLLDKKEKLILSLQPTLGSYPKDRATAVFQNVICPTFVQFKSEFSWLVGWASLVLSEYQADVTVLSLLAKNLNNISSPLQYSILKDKIRANITSMQWNKLGADEPGKQTGQVAVQELPIKEEPRFARYFKMLKVGLPLEAAAVKMSSDQAVDSYEEAVAVLSLDPSKPMPDKYKATAPVTRRDSAEPRDVTSVIAPVVSSMTDTSSANSVDISALAFISVVHESFRAVVAQLHTYVAEENMKDFGFVWEEFQKASSVHADIEDNYLFPALDKVSRDGVTALRMWDEHDTEKRAAQTVGMELKLKKAVSEEVFEHWSELFQAHLDKEDRAVLPLEVHLGADSEERASAVAKKIINPTFLQNKSDFVWSMGWTAMMVSENGYQGKSVVEALGQLVNGLQAVCSFNQYLLVKPKIKSNVTSEQWSRLVKDFDAESAGKQPEPEFQKPSIKDDVRFQKFFKMLKIGLPVDAAAQQMVREQAFGITDYDVAVAVLSSEPNSPFDENIFTGF